MYGICLILCGFCLKCVLSCKDVELSCICLYYLEWVKFYPVCMFLSYYSGYCFDFVVLYCLFVISCLTLGCHNLSSKFIKYQFMFFLVFYCHFFACSVPFLSSLFFLLSCLSSYFLILPCSLVFLFSCLSLHFLILPCLVLSYYVYLSIWGQSGGSRSIHHFLCFIFKVSLCFLYCSCIQSLEKPILLKSGENQRRWNSIYRLELYGFPTLCTLFIYWGMARIRDIGTAHSDYMYVLYCTVCTLHI